MISYSCKYTPVELLAAFEANPTKLDGEEKDFEYAESLTHANLCSHAKALIQQGRDKDELILMDCCDSLRRSYDVLKHDKAFIRLMDLPHDSGECAKERFAKELLNLIEDYKTYSKKDFNRELFIKACKKAEYDLPGEDYIAVMGARVSPPLEELISRSIGLPVVNLTCSGKRNLGPLPDNAEDMGLEELIGWYAGALLSMIPCMRMVNVNKRRRLTEDEHLRGVVYNTVKFCDFYSFDYAKLKQETDLPILKIESDYMPQPYGQLSTRLEAFTESLGLEEKKEVDMNYIQKGLYAGIDSGSTTTNMVVLDENKNVLASTIVRTGAKAQNGAQNALNEVCKKLGVKKEDFRSIVATGYGRNNIPFATQTKTEITCHAHGAFFLNPQIRTIIDIGGQDSKVICLDETGNVTGFTMNDKCAAGTGRFLEMMARTLEMDLGEMSLRGLDWKKDLTISSMCTVFAESEVISLIADNNSENDIIHGLNKSIATKTVSMVKRTKGTPNYMMTGGVARNKGVVKELEQRLGEPLFITDEPDLCGAMGAALFALEEGAYAKAQ